MHIIAFEGIDNAGKTTQCERLLRKLAIEEYRVVNTLNHSSKIHEVIKEYFQRGEFSPYLKTLLFAAELSDHLSKCTEETGVIIFDRYVYSLLAYGLTENLKRSWIENVIAFLPKADLVIYLDIPVEVYWGRAKEREEYISPYPIDNLQTTRENYRSLAEEFDFLSIDGTRGVDDIENLIHQQVGNIINPQG